MTRSPPSNEQVAILSADAEDIAAFCHEIQQADYRTTVYSSVDQLDEGLVRNPCFAVILDADGIELNDFIIRKLKSRHPQTHFLLASRNPFHPELQESISRILYACLRKPANLEEITYLFRSISLRIPNRGTAVLDQGQSVETP